MFVLAVSLAITTVNSIGLFSHVTEIEVGEVNQTLTEGITEIDSNITSESDAADNVAGTSMLLSVYETMKTMLTLIFLPYKFLVKDLGVPVYLAAPIQIIFNSTFVWATIQFISGRSTRTMD